MGYRWPLVLSDARGQEWIGQHRPELIDLLPAFQRLIELEASDQLFLEQWRAVLPPELHLVRALGPRAVHVHCRTSGVRDLVIKLCLPKERSRWRWLTERARHSRSHRAYFWAHRLRALGIETPRPLGFIERAHYPALDKSFTVSEYIFAPTLTEIRDGGLVPAEGQRDVLLEKRTLIRRVAALLRELHQNRLFHGDLHAGNLMVAKDTVVVIDLESIRPFGGRRRQLLDNLVRLNRDFLDLRLLSRTDRLRFLDAYLRNSGRRRLLRELFTEVATATELKLKERGEQLSRGNR